MSNLKPRLWHALWEAGLGTVPDLYRQCYGEALRQGAAEQARLATSVGADMWARLLADWNRPCPEDAFIHLLGVGRMLTEFFVAPLALPEESREAVVRLGALANLIVALYDTLVDEGDGSEQNPLPRPALLNAANPKAAHASGKGSAVAHLVTLYFRRLSVLPGADMRPAIRHCLQRAIVRMYDAERQTLALGSPDEMRRIWRRKSALPLVIMGLPAWLTAPIFNERRYKRHLRWLYRAGEFWGWIDDVLDLLPDAQTGQPNRVQAILASHHEEEAVLARRIAALGQTSLAQWRLETPNAAALPPFITEAVPTLLVSSFGGLSLSLPTERR